MLFSFFFPFPFPFPFIPSERVRGVSSNVMLSSTISLKSSYIVSPLCAVSVKRRYPKIFLCVLCEDRECQCLVILILKRLIILMILILIVILRLSLRLVKIIPGEGRLRSSGAGLVSRPPRLSNLSKVGMSA